MFLVRTDRSNENSPLKFEFEGEKMGSPFLGTIPSSIVLLSSPKMRVIAEWYMSELSGGNKFESPV